MNDQTTQNEIFKNIDELDSRFNQAGHGLWPRYVLTSLKTNLKNEAPEEGRNLILKLLNDKINSINTIPDLDQRLTALEQLLNDGLRGEEGKYGGLYWLLIDKQLRDRVLNTYFDIIEGLAQKNVTKKSQEVLNAAQEIITMLGKNFAVSQPTIQKFNKLKVQVKPVPPGRPTPPQQPGLLDQLNKDLMMLEDSLRKLDKTLSNV